MQMAELSLLPAVRAAPDALVVADGTSCRHQIADGAGARRCTWRGCWPITWLDGAGAGGVYLGCACGDLGAFENRAVSTPIRGSR